MDFFIYMRAKATQFDNQVFRSRIEAYLWRYVQLMFDPETLEYEPEQYTTINYCPDFIVSSERIHFAVEVKPLMEKAKFHKYRAWLNKFTNIDYLIVYTPTEWEKIDRYNNRWAGKINKLRYFQAVNDVKANFKDVENG